MTEKSTAYKIAVFAVVLAFIGLSSGDSITILDNIICTNCTLESPTINNYTISDILKINKSGDSISDNAEFSNGNIKIKFWTDNSELRLSSYGNSLRLTDSETDLNSPLVSTDTISTYDSFRDYSKTTSLACWNDIGELISCGGNQSIVMSGNIISTPLNETWETSYIYNISNNCKDCIVTITTPYNNSDRWYNITSKTLLPHFHNGTDSDVYINLAGNETQIGKAVNSSNVYVSASNPISTFKCFDGIETTTYKNTTCGTTVPLKYSSKIKTTNINSFISWGVVNSIGQLQGATSNDKYVAITAYYGTTYLSNRDTTKVEVNSGAGSFPDGTYKITNLYINSSASRLNLSGYADLIQSGQIPTVPLFLSMRLLDQTGRQEYSYTSTYPTNGIDPFILSSYTSGSLSGETNHDSINSHLAGIGCAIAIIDEKGNIHRGSSTNC